MGKEHCGIVCARVPPEQNQNRDQDSKIIYISQERRFFLGIIRIVDDVVMPLINTTSSRVDDDRFTISVPQRKHLSIASLHPARYIKPHCGWNDCSRESTIAHADPPLLTKDRDVTTVRKREPTIQHHVTQIATTATRRLRIIRTSTAFHSAFNEQTQPPQREILCVQKTSHEIQHHDADISSPAPKKSKKVLNPHTHAPPKSRTPILYHFATTTLPHTLAKPGLRSCIILQLQPSFLTRPRSPDSDPASFCRN